MRCVLCLLVWAGMIVSSAVADDHLAANVELFAAKDAGQIEVQLIPKDSTQSTVLIKNNTDAPLHIALPEAFAGVPVLAQIGGQGGGFNVGGGGNQGVGGGFGGGGMGGGGFGGGGGVFSVGPDSVRKLKVTTVCLEHGKDEPRPKIAYEIRPIEALTEDPRVIALVTMLGKGEIDQQTAQAASWQLTDGLSWDELLNMVKVEHLNGTREFYFNRQQITRAMQIVAEVTRQVGIADNDARGDTRRSSGTEAYDRYRQSVE